MDALVDSLTSRSTTLPGQTAEHSLRNQQALGQEQYGTTAQLLSIVMPIYNERHTLKVIFDRLLKVPFQIPIEVIAVDDASTDGSTEMLRQIAASDNRIRALYHDKNQGKAQAVRTAINSMQGTLAIIQDADLEYNPSEIPNIIAPILDGRADAVFGSRFASSGSRRVLYFWHSLANQVLTLLTNAICDLNLTDMETCYKAIRADILRQLPLKAEGFGIEPELTVRLSQWGARIYEVPISYSGRTYAEGKKIKWTDALQVFWVLFCTTVLDRRFTTHDGFYVLKTLHGSRLSQWMLEQFSKYVGQNVFEAGCGIGNFTELLLDRRNLTCADFEPAYVDLMNRKYGYRESFSARVVNLEDEADFGKLEPASYDTIICLNVLEHLKDDAMVLNNFFRLLKPGGHAIVLVPQHMWLYTPIDEAVGHYRRYSHQELKTKMELAGFQVVQQTGFNKLGVPGWFVNGKLLRRRDLGNKQVWLFDKLIGAAKLIENIPGLPALSVIAVGQRV